MATHACKSWIRRLPQLHGATGAPVEVHLGLRLQKRRRSLALALALTLTLTAGHLALLSLSASFLSEGCSSIRRSDII